MSEKKTIYNWAIYNNKINFWSIVQNAKGV